MIITNAKSGSSTDWRKLNILSSLRTTTYCFRSPKPKMPTGNWMISSSLISRVPSLVCNSIISTPFSCSNVNRHLPHLPAYIRWTNSNINLCSPWGPIHFQLMVKPNLGPGPGDCLHIQLRYLCCHLHPGKVGENHIFLPKSGPVQNGVAFPYPASNTLQHLVVTGLPHLGVKVLLATHTDFGIAFLLVYL